MPKYFIDTNIIIYANDNKDTQKQTLAIDLIKKLMAQGNGVISTQVLQEYAYTGIKKLHQEAHIVLRQLKLLQAFEVVNQSPGQIFRAVEIMQAYKIGFWDSCIISNAEQGNCSVILSEDLNTGQFYSGIQIINPFQ